MEGRHVQRAAWRCKPGTSAALTSGMWPGRVRAASGLSWLSRDVSRPDSSHSAAVHASRPAFSRLALSASEIVCGGLRRADAPLSTVRVAVQVPARYEIVECAVSMRATGDRG